MATAMHTVIEASLETKSVPDFSCESLLPRLTDPSFAAPGISGEISFDAAGDRGLGIPMEVSNHIAGGGGFELIALMRKNGTLDTSAASVPGAPAKSSWEYARPDLADVNTPLSAADIFSTPQALGLCGVLGESDSGGGTLLASYCNSRGLCTDRGCLCDEGWGAQFCTEERTRPARVTLGMLFPLMKVSEGVQVTDHGGKRRLLGALMAIDDINNKRPPYQDLLPETEIVFTVRDSKRSTAEASLQALDLLDVGVDAVIGAASSGPSGQQVTSRLSLTRNVGRLLTLDPPPPSRPVSHYLPRAGLPSSLRSTKWPRSRTARQAPL